MANHKRERYVQEFEKMIDNLEYYEALKIVGILYHTCAHYHQRMGIVINTQKPLEIKGFWYFFMWFGRTLTADYHKKRVNIARNNF